MAETFVELVEEKAKSKKQEISLKDWLEQQLNAPPGKRMHIATHVAKYTHPAISCPDSGKEVAILCPPKILNDSKEYLTGSSFKTNLIDYVGNAANIPYAKTLEAVLEDGRTVAWHLLNSSDLLKQTVGLSEQQYVEMRESFKKWYESCKSCAHSHKRVKQIYYPLPDGEYRLMSLLPCSTMIWELSNRIKEREWKQIPEGKKQKSIRVAYVDKWQRKYGGSKPQNVSFLNSNNGGNVKALVCLPPKLNRTVRLPKGDFFRMIYVAKPRHENVAKNSLWGLFVALAKTLVKDPNTDWARRKKRGIIRNIVEWGIIRFAGNIAEEARPGWTKHNSSAGLPKEQIIWLDPHREDINALKSDLPGWSDLIARATAGFVIKNLEKVAKAEHVALPSVKDEVFVAEIAKLAREYIYE
jgi:CRISPR-associated protein Csy1